MLKILFFMLNYVSDTCWWINFYKYVDVQVFEEITHTHLHLIIYLFKFAWILAKFLFEYYKVLNYSKNL